MKISRKINQVLGNFEVPDGLVVLTYHRVNNVAPADSLVVRPADFARQMAFLSAYSKRFKVVGLDEALGYIKKMGTVPIEAERCPGDSPHFFTRILITFDDGYEDNYEQAFPVLKRYRFPAVVFMTTGRIGHDGWLSERQIRKMSCDGIEFGAHTVTHPHLTEISHEEAGSEIKSSGHMISDLLKRKARAFCYPFGDHNKEIRSMVEEAGYDCAFSVKVGVNHEGQDPYEIRRIDVLGEDSFPSFKYKITEKFAVGAAL